MKADPCSRWGRVEPNVDPHLDFTNSAGFRQLSKAARLPAGPKTFDTVRDRMRRYDLYPGDIVEGKVCSKDGLVQQGCTIAQTARLGPWRLTSAVRVFEANEADAPGERVYRFAYVTLAGHPERGVIRFKLRELGPDVSFEVEAWSRPGRWWSILGRPVAWRWQKRANLRMVRNMQRFAEAVSDRAE